ncbi:MAG: hypothetical protein NZ921_05070, partial [Candidatus Caldarchaeum sp.]|nr:hypothetical protein [Candidatus Caldarchaeum sp.]
LIPREGIESKEIYRWFSVGLSGGAQMKKWREECLLCGEYVYVIYLPSGEKQCPKCRGRWQEVV